MNNKPRFKTFERKAVPKVTASRKVAHSNSSRSGESESYQSNEDSGMSEVSSTESSRTKLGSESLAKQTVNRVRTKFPEISPKQNQTVYNNKSKLAQRENKIQKVSAFSESKLKSIREVDTISYENDHDRAHGSKEGVSDEKTDMPEKKKSESVLPQIVKSGLLMRDVHRTMSNSSPRDSNSRVCNNSQDLEMKRLSIETHPVSGKGRVGPEKDAVPEEKDTVPARPDLKFTRKVNLVGGPTRSKLELCDFVNHDVIGGDEVCVTSFGPTKLTYLDYVASGRPLKCIENYIRYHVMPFYANTHTEVSHFAAQTTRFREEARSIIRESVHANEDDAVIFCGSGSTAAIHKVIHALDLRRSPYTMPPVVFIGPYEHHSNILPWIEAKAKVIRIQLSRNGLIDLVHLEEELKEAVHGPDRLLIGSFSAASNVTGILTDTVTISKLMHRYKGFALFDYACAAPYVEIDMNCADEGPLAYKDAVFISTHKFLGGPQTPGILIAKRSMFRNQVPHGAGGGTVVFVRRHGHKYHKEAEHREEGGTPAVIESIRAGLVFKLKETFTSTFIMGRETRMLQRAIAAWSNHPNLLLLGDLSVERLPIFSMLFRNRETGRLLHHDFVAMLLNDLFGLQVRSGCACAALYGLKLEIAFLLASVRHNVTMMWASQDKFHKDLLGMSEDVAEKYEQLITLSDAVSNKRDSVKEDDDDAMTDNVIFKPGFVRLNFPFFLTESCFNFVIKAVLMTAEMGWRLLPLYDFDRRTGKWWYKNNTVIQPLKSLSDMTFTKGSFNMNISKDLKVDCSQDTVTKSKSPTWLLDGSMPGLYYEEILERSRYLFEEAKERGRFESRDQTRDFDEAAHKLRWFMLPSEAVDVINGRKVTCLAPDDLPFIPVALAEKLETQNNNRYK